ncbi:uncharacterized protein LOC125652707 isoform X2 [Ostrea edulis]|uniref:uncharacterized protein LOC125652707 isoform X2 n=1 Tax=Ostrea edulis TaxID=37623 RepID=UPI002096507C|nr:uncharacterized protein LOC125652707 isoform X2 [Ostrea edulis]
MSMGDESPPRNLGRLSPESGIVLEGTECTVNSEKSLEELAAVESARSNGLPPNQLYNFNLANPEEVMTMLETVNLTDEDTDVLLQEAYNINKKLKEVLRRRDEGQVLDAADQAILNQMVVVVPGSSKEGRSSTANEDQSASGGLDIPKKDPLPPIKTDTEQNPRVASAIYSAKLNRRAPLAASSGRSGVRKQGGAMSGDVVWKRDRVGSGVSRTSVQKPGSSIKLHILPITYYHDSF